MVKSLNVGVSSKYSTLHQKPGNITKQTTLSVYSVLKLLMIKAQVCVVLLPNRR